MACAESPSRVTRSLVHCGACSPVNCPHFEQDVAAPIIRRSFSPALGKAASISSTLLGTDQDCSVQPGCWRTADEIDELALPNVVADDEAAVAGPLVHMAVVISPSAARRLGASARQHIVPA